MNTPWADVTSKKYIVAMGVASLTRMTVARDAPSDFTRSHAAITA